MADNYIEELKVKVRDREDQLRIKEEELTALKRRVD
jgi:hypothetical protein